MDASAPHTEAEKIGSATLALVEAIMRAKPHPEQGFRSCLGILRLAKEYGVARLEAACRRGNDIGARSYGSIASILQHGLDRAYAQEKAPEGAPIQHANMSQSQVGGQLQQIQPARHNDSSFLRPSARGR